MEIGKRDTREKSEICELSFEGRWNEEMKGKLHVRHADVTATKQRQEPAHAHFVVKIAVSDSVLLLAFRAQAHLPFDLSYQVTVRISHWRCG